MICYYCEYGSLVKSITFHRLKWIPTFFKGGCSESQFKDIEQANTFGKLFSLYFKRALTFILLVLFGPIVIIFASPFFLFFFCYVKCLEQNYVSFNAKILCTILILALCIFIYLVNPFPDLNTLKRFLVLAYKVIITSGLVLFVGKQIIDKYATKKNAKLNLYNRYLKALELQRKIEIFRLKQEQRKDPFLMKKSVWKHALAPWFGLSISFTIIFYWFIPL